jgi:hypothetical protein
LWPRAVWPISGGLDLMASLLGQCGEALFGPQWQSALARALDVSDRTVRRWIANDQVPSGVYLDLLRLTQERAQVLDAMAGALRQAGAVAELSAPGDVIASVRTKTFTADVLRDGTCLVGGLHAGKIAGAATTGRELERQRSMRADIQRAVYEQVTASPDDPTAGAIVRWNAK